MATEAPYDLIVVGGGAAGFFGAIIAAEKNPQLSVLILEKTPKLLSKVRVSGGGRCNVTHNCFEPTPFSKHYPRGQKELKKLFRTFQARDMIEWLKSKSVEVKAETDGRIFPVTDNSQTIIDCFLQEAKSRQIKIITQASVSKIEKRNHHFEISIDGGQIFLCKKVLITTGGYNHRAAYGWIEKMGHKIHEPIPSLFTFNDTQKSFKDLMGVAVPQAAVKIAGTKFSQQGAVLITHWGLSGPAILKLSSWAAEYLNQKQYSFIALVNWTGDMSEDALRTTFDNIKRTNGSQVVTSHPRFQLPGRLWQRLCELAEIPESKIWAEVPLKHINRLIEFLIRCPFQIKGKTTFKEEFVTCGGVDLDSIDLETMESKVLPDVYFAGEVLNIDGETGGFNFQAAWTTGYVAGTAIANCRTLP